MQQISQAVVQANIKSVYRGRPFFQGTQLPAEEAWSRRLIHWWLEADYSDRVHVSEFPSHWLSGRSFRKTFLSCLLYESCPFRCNENCLWKIFPHWVIDCQNMDRRILVHCISWTRLPLELTSPTWVGSQKKLQNQNSVETFGNSRETTSLPIAVYQNAFASFVFLKFKKFTAAFLSLVITVATRIQPLSLYPYPFGGCMAFCIAIGMSPKSGSVYLDQYSFWEWLMVPKFTDPK